jgi:hypothetical protein
MNKLYVFCLTIFGILTSVVANAQMVSLNADGTIAGNMIHKSDNFAYYSCAGAISDNLIPVGHSWLTSYSKMLEVPPPQDQNCVVSQGLPGTLFAYSISVDYFISDANSRCFYNDYCNDTRRMSFHVKDKAIFLNFMVINAAKSLTKQMCVGVGGKIINQTGCSTM